MPAKEPSGDHPSIGPSSTHSWLSPEGRRFGNRIKQAAASPVLYYLPSQFRLRSFDWQLVYIVSANIRRRRACVDAGLMMLSTYTGASFWARRAVHRAELGDGPMSKASCIASLQATWRGYPEGQGSSVEIRLG